MTGLDDRDPSGRFVRGLTLGALLGAIIAGSSIWTRSRARRRAERIKRHDEPNEVLPADALPADALATDGSEPRAAETVRPSTAED